MADNKDTNGDNDFSLLFSSSEDKDAAKRRCLKLIEDELQKLPESEESDPTSLQSCAQELDENLVDVSAESQLKDNECDITNESDADTTEVSELRKSEIENVLYEKIFLFTLEDGSRDFLRI